MTTFNDREKAFENKFAHDAEMQFKAARPHATRCSASGRPRSSARPAADADAYAMEVVKADFAEVGHEDVFRKLATDLDYRADEQTIRAKMNELLAQAKSQLIERDWLASLRRRYRPTTVHRGELRRERHRRRRPGSTMAGPAIPEESCELPPPDPRGLPR